MTDAKGFTNIFRAALLPLLLVVAAFALFGPALGHDFLVNWDDGDYVTANHAVTGFTLPHLREAFTSFFVGNYAPLHIVSYMLDYELWGMQPAGFVFTNIVLHSASGLLFWLLLKRLAPGRVWPFAAALIFLLHPVQVESVVWVSQRKNVLCMLFFLAAFHGYLRYRERGKVLPYLLSVAAFTCALLAKSVAVILPVLLILFDVCYGERKRLKSLLLDKLPFIAVAFVIALVALKSQSTGGRTSFYGGSPFATFLTMLPVFVSYVRMIIWPSGLSAWYHVPVMTTLTPRVAGAATVCFLLVLLGFFLYRRDRRIFFWYALFFAGLVPVSQIVPIVTLMNDRYLYFPLLGGAAFLALVLFGDAGWSNVSRRGKVAVCSGIFVIAIAAWAVVAVDRVSAWQNSYTLWSDAARKAPDTALPHDCLGEALLERKDIDGAIAQFRLALAYENTRNATPRDNFVKTHNNLGLALSEKGLRDQAIAEFSRAVALDPGYAMGYDNIGCILVQQGRVAEAIPYFTAALERNPRVPLYSQHLAEARKL